MGDLSGPRHGGRVGSLIKGKWQVDARIGAGGMATVYSATHKKNGLRVALKMLHAQLSRDTDIRTRFLREAYVANAIDHPNICRVLDDDVTDDGLAYLVLELLEGESIESKRLARGGALPVDEVLGYADQALDALAAAHEKGIVHRDVKPDNVFITNDGLVKLLDFGLARMKDNTAEATKTGVTIGTPEFMPPEQALGRRDDIDARSDVWGLGATLFTSISGKYVHDANTLHEQLMASATQRARSLRSVVEDMDPLIAAAVDRALELEQDDRFQSAREMQNALRMARRGSDSFSMDSLTVHKAASPISSGTLPPATPSSDERTIAIIGPISTPQMPKKGFAEAETTLDLMAPVSFPVSSLPISSPPMTPAVITERIGYSPRAQLAAPPAPNGFEETYRMPSVNSMSPSGGVPSLQAEGMVQYKTMPLQANLLTPQQPQPPPTQGKPQSAAYQSSPGIPSAVVPIPQALMATVPRQRAKKKPPGKAVWVIAALMILFSAAISAYLLWRGGRLF